MSEQLKAADLLNEPDYDPETALEAEKAEKLAQSAREKEEEQASEATAFLIISSYEGILKSIGHADFSLSDEMKKTAIERYQPIIVKYGPEALGLFGLWQAEIMAGIFTATLLKESFSQIGALKEEQKIKDKIKAQSLKPPAKLAREAQLSEA
jgi:hypothetical protein